MPDDPQPAGPARRFRTWLIGALLLALGAVGALGAATLGVEWLETRSSTAVRQALAADGVDWAKVSSDGWTLRLIGTAPDEIARVRALATASNHVALSRIKDQIVVPPPAEAAPPTFRLEILRNNEGASVIGLVPSSLDQNAVMQRLAKSQGGTAPSNLIEEADYPAPAGWDAAVALALDAAELAPRAKITATPGAVEVTAVTDGEAEKSRLEEALRTAAPKGITLTTSISAPRPVIAPFTLKLSRTDGTATLAPCAVGSPQGRERILTAAKSAGVVDGDCTVALGEPSPQWVDAAVAAIDAAKALPSGSVTLTDAAVSLEAPASVPEAEFAAVRDQLSNKLPAAFSLTATLAKAEHFGEPGPVSFDATATSSGVHLRGTVSDDRMRSALESFAGSRFGQVDSTLTVNTNAPSGWTVRVLGVLRVMADLERGSATVTPDTIRISGATGSKTASDALAASLGQFIGAGVPYEFSLTYDPRLDPAVDLPTGEQCVTRANEAMGKATIGFETNRATIVGDPAETMAQLARALQKCEEFRIELGGHTDTQGSDTFNMELSQNRAAAVLAAMKAAGINTELMVSKGYGETRPIAENTTEAGRTANRRIEFRLLSPYPVSENIGPATVVKGLTTAQPRPESNDQPERPAPAATSSDMPMMDRLPGVPPALAGLESAVPTSDLDPAAAAETSAASEEPEPTPDEQAAAEGIALRPEEITVQGNRVSTPVPPPFIGPMPDTPESSSRRPPARPEQ